MHKVKATIGSEVNSCLRSCLSHNLRTKANLMKLHRKIKHDPRSRSQSGVKDQFIGPLGHLLHTVLCIIFFSANRVP